jgi:hypothetical protein
MALETGSYISDLVATNPPGSDPKAQGDDHLRLIKSVVKNCFAGFAGSIIVTGTDGGAVNAYTVTSTPAVPAYVARMIVLFSPTITNTGASTINVSGLGVKDIKSVSGAALAANELVPGILYFAVYNGTEFRLSSITKAYADALAFSGVLPAQPGTTEAFNLQSLNGSATWEPKASLIRRAITGADTVGLADVGNLIEITSGTFTLSFLAAATLGARASGWISNAGSGDVTLDPNGAETIDGLTSFVMYRGEIRRWWVEGGNIRTHVIKPFCTHRRSTVNFIWPPGYFEIEFDASGGGGGGGSGRRGAAGTPRKGGAAGGAPGRIQRRLTNITAGTSITITVGAGGAGGAAQTVNDTNGNAGTAGGDTTIGSFFTAYGGAGGIGGPGATTGGLTSGSGSGSRGQGANNGTPGGHPQASNFGAASANNSFNISEGGGGTITGFFTGSCTEMGGAGSGQSDDGVGTPVTSGSSLRGVSAAGCGGWINTANAMPAIAGTAGLNGTYTVGGGAAGGTCGASPTAGTNGADAASEMLMGNPGGGGGSSITVAAAAGGNGGDPSGPGGGGGASLNGFNSGAGGNGRDGRVLISGRA